MTNENFSPASRIEVTSPGIHLFRTYRRRFLGQALMGAAALLAVPGAFAEALTRTARLTEGPFYPDKLPLDTDNDLLIINDKITPAVGVVTHLSGRILSESGEPVRNALVELWQADNNGAYIHSGTINRDRRDPNFEGYGRFLTDSKGQYCFRTIKPVAYPGRAPHIHFAVSRGDHRVLTTQLLIKGNPQNQNDGVFRELTDPRQRETVLADFKALPESTAGELVANFEIVVGVTPEAPEHRHGPGPGPRFGPGPGPGRGPRRP